MIEYFKSVNNKYTYDKYLKNETPIMDENKECS